MAKKILVVDDEIESVKLIGLMLQRRGYEIVAARSGSQALEKAYSEHPDLVILDVMMPDMDGYEVCRRLRADPDTANLPIIMFTSKAMVDDKVTGFQAGADDYLTKPVHPEELASRIEAVLLRSARKQVEGQSERRASVIAFVGAKGGTGVSTLAVNISVLLSKMMGEQKVLLADMKPGLAASSQRLGLRRHGEMAQLLEESLEHFDLALVEAHLEEHHSGLLVLSGQLAPLGMATAMTVAYADALLHLMGSMADYVVLDIGIGIDGLNRRILPKCDLVVLAIEPQRYAIEMGRMMLEEMVSSFNMPRHRISMVMINKSPSASTLDRDTIEDMAGHDLAGVVTPAAEMAFQELEKGIPMVLAQPTALACQQIRVVAQHILDSV
ncbi:MAG TPA: response regulator [Chloroflexi bacterium]|nr:response regulator [Chloroflexota bacterium]